MHKTQPCLLEITLLSFRVRDGFRGKFYLIESVYLRSWTRNSVREYGLYPHENKEKKEQDVRKKRMVSEAAESTWKLVKDSNNPEDLRYFLEQFPDSPYAIPAKLKLKQLERENQNKQFSTYPVSDLVRQKPLY